MTRPTLRVAPLALLILVYGAGAGAKPVDSVTWSTVVNNGDFIPTDTCDPAAPDPTTCRTYNSYNQPSVNEAQLVVFRARSRGGQGLGEPVHGVYTRDMGDGGPVVKILDRDTLVPEPNNTDAEFIEPPSFPRIDIHSDTMATRGNHPPVWTVLDEQGEIVEQLGTTGIYTNPFADLLTGASKLGSVDAFSFFEVPEAPSTPFDVFPGAPSVTEGDVIVFKGNYTVADVGRTGAYFRDLDDEPIPAPDGALLVPAGGTNPVVLIANNVDTLIPGTTTVFGSVAPPSAADGLAVFAGFDNEDAPTLGGLYLAPLTGPEPPLVTLVSIGGSVPGQGGAVFERLSEGVSFDGRFVAFWGAWGTETETLILQCPTEGNQDRIEFCNQQHPDGFAVEVLVNQGIFVHDLQTGRTREVATAPDDYTDFLFWNFSGAVPETAEDAEPARWRASAFVAVSGDGDGRGNDATFLVAFKARTGEVMDGAYVDPVDGIYLARGPGNAPVTTLIETGMDGTLFDPEAVDPDTGAVLPVTEMGIERDGFRGDTIVINASFGTEEAGWAGIYLTELD